MGGCGCDQALIALPSGKSQYKNPTHVYSTGGTFNVCLTVTRTDSLGAVLCTDTWCDSVMTGVRHIPGGWHQVYAGGIGNSNSVVAQGAEEEVEMDTQQRGFSSEAGKVEVYPNPMVDVAHIRFEQFNGPFSFHLIDHTGRMIIQHTDLTNGEITIEKGNWVAGVYFYQVNSNSQQISGKLIIR